jgi:hypothetical protein
MGYNYFERARLTPAEEKRLLEGRRISNLRERHNQKMSEKAQKYNGGSQRAMSEARAESKARRRWLSGLGEEAKN